MSILEKVQILPPDKQKQVEEFVDSLINQYQDEVIGQEEDLAAKRKKNIGWARGKIWMADDFNATPEEFNEYL